MTEKFLELIQSCGVTRAAAVSPNDVVYNAVFRDICAQNACGLYGACHMCPPAIGPVEALMEKAKRYTLCLMYQNVFDIEDSFDIEGMMDAKQTHHQRAQLIDQKVRGLTNEPFLHLEAGGCGICTRCAKRDNLPCRFPDKALSSLEGYGIDVYHTAANAGLRYINGQNTVTYFGMLFLQEKDHA